ncbi:hypothetical protein BO70DRAFT_12922 [Aspergillus heteromorphus CBS 117.55]|uniref:Uncharacterized protein n=1 Tax=Aspergillus heteromorphus CBS 117.55 TaxID=1448321 RepID=A0A317X1T2_9EURO|nr:uncharacterized protein BO70DRAFT_12922 [Aspergillus heteromorphus CBS 117.55]PWY92513.1 hypothetical protein BO70DRAFT_12922 [Aspergillus heteromorphus CBS 117.55]
MHTAALLFALSLSAHAIPVFQPRGNDTDTLERRDPDNLPYKVVDVAGPTTPVVETITITQSPSSSSTPYPSWTLEPTASGSPFERHEANDSNKRAFRRFGSIADASSSSNNNNSSSNNSTDARAIIPRSNDTASPSEVVARGHHNETEHALHARGNSSAEVVARTEDAADLSERFTLNSRGSVHNETGHGHGRHARSNETEEVFARSAHNETAHGHHARSNETEEVFAHSAHNETAHGHHARSNSNSNSNSTSEVFSRAHNETAHALHARSNETAEVFARGNDTISKIATRGLNVTSRELNSTKVSEPMARALTEDAAVIDKHANSTDHTVKALGARSSNGTASIQARNETASDI